MNETTKICKILMLLSRNILNFFFTQIYLNYLKLCNNNLID